MSASRKAGYYWVKYVSQDHWSIEYWNGGMWFTRNPHLVDDSMFSTIDETTIEREQKLSEQQSEQLVCDHPDEAIIRDEPTDYCLACNRNI